MTYRGWEHVTEADLMARAPRGSSTAKSPMKKSPPGENIRVSARGPEGSSTTRQKYGAVKTVVDGITFDSKKEAARYQELKLREQAGEIQDLRLQPSFDLEATFWMMGGESVQIKIGGYVADFKYIERETQAVVIEDVKGFKTPLYRWKKKHVEAQYGIEIKET